MQVALKQLRIQPGQQLLLEDVSWQQLEDILNELGNSRASRLSYSYGKLEILAPLAEHEKAKEMIGDLVKILLDAKNIDYESLGSTTLKNRKMTQAVEPDACFYIKNYAAVIGKNRLNLESDPPPDLAIEIDLTSRTQLENYRLLGVPELWRYSPQGLQISILERNEYREADVSLIFPNIPIIEVVNRHVRQSQGKGRSETIRAFKQWVEKNV